MAKKNEVKILKYILLCLFFVVMFLFVMFNDKDNEDRQVNNDKQVNKDDKIDPIPIDLGHGLIVKSIGQYSGLYYEDGTNDEVENILAVEVTNTSNKTLQYCDVILKGTDETACFSLSTLKPEESVVVLECNKKVHTPNTYKSGVINNVVFFDEEPSLNNDVFEINLLNGALNVKNISGKDINNDIYIYYKNFVEDTYYGGITYRCKLEGGIQSEEIKQLYSSHCTTKHTKIMFVDIVEQ